MSIPVQLVFVTTDPPEKDDVSESGNQLKIHQTVYCTGYFGQIYDSLCNLKIMVIRILILAKSLDPRVFIHMAR